MSWRQIKYPLSSIQLSATLTGGQSFRWTKYGNSKNEPDCWIGVMANCVWLLKQTENGLLYKIVGEISYQAYKDFIHFNNNPKKIKKCKQDYENEFKFRMKTTLPDFSNDSSSGLIYHNEYYETVLSLYLRLEIDLQEHYKTWQENDVFKKQSEKLYAVRMLNQDPIENIFSFICSQNNNISRISGLVEKLCVLYGPKICDFEGKSYHAFPDFVSMIDENVINQLKDLKFGYRARYIQQTASEIQSQGGYTWLQTLETLDIIATRNELMKLPGIGPKVADCVCLMSLNHLDAIPVDTHIFQIAKKYYLPELAGVKTVNAKVYNEIGNKFRELFGPLAGWAQTVLFCSDLSRAEFKSNNKIK